MKKKLLIALGIIIVLVIGMGLGYKGTLLALEANFKGVFPSASLDEKDVFVKSISLDGNLKPKELLKNTKKAKNVIFII